MSNSAETSPPGFRIQGVQKVASHICFALLNYFSSKDSNIPNGNNRLTQQKRNKTSIYKYASYGISKLCLPKAKLLQPHKHVIKIAPLFEKQWKITNSQFKIIQTTALMGRGEEIKLGLRHKFCGRFRHNTISIT
jgi:hypothetical protein